MSTRARSEARSGTGTVAGTGATAGTSLGEEAGTRVNKRGGTTRMQRLWRQAVVYQEQTSRGVESADNTNNEGLGLDVLASLFPFFLSPSSGGAGAGAGGPLSSSRIRSKASQKSRYKEVGECDYFSYLTNLSLSHALLTYPPNTPFDPLHLFLFFRNDWVY